MSIEGEREARGDRLSRVEALYHEMLARPAHERAAALASACPDDPTLAAEVQSLLDQPDSSAGPLGTPALEVASRFVSGASAALSGKRLGAFEVQGLLGVGGMGEVYRAHDPKLGRDVAIKVLPTPFANDPDRLARFRREARVLASLNHPNIAAIHGLEEADGRTFLVMELVEGEDLAERLARGALPVDQAVKAARQIAEGLEEAHEKGIVHRDLKPANIKVRPDGSVKVLDFGLAKAYAPEKNIDDSRSDVSHSPTRSQPTKAGMVLGTAAYMAPEQARGAPVDRRADIWSFGVVLFEMLTGAWLFKGETPSDSLAAVLKTEPDWTRLPADTPRSVAELLRRCLDRDPKRRLQSIGEARIVLADHGSSGPAMNVPMAPDASARRSPGFGSVAPWLVAAALAIALVIAGSRPAAIEPRASNLPRKLQVRIGAEASLSIGWGASAILSPDGATLAFVAEQTEPPGVRLFVRPLNQLQATALPGTDGAVHPFFSPDGQWIGFFAEGKLKKVAVAGGPVVSLCDVPSGRGGTWGEDGTIVFAPDASTPLLRVAATGGTPVPVGTDGYTGGTHRFPQLLPGGKGILFTRDKGVTPAGFEKGDVVLAPLPSGTPKVIVPRAYYGRYVPSGHVIYVQKDRLFAARFDLDRMEVIGQGVPILDAVGASVNSGGAQFAFSSEGTLVYLPESFVPAPVSWAARDGQTSLLRPTASNWANPRFSPDGWRLAFEINDGKQRDIFVYELERGTLTQLTFDPGDDSYAIWSPDGRRIAFSSDRGQPGVANLYWMNADGSNDAKRLTQSTDNELAGSWHPSGKWLAFWTANPKSMDLRILPLEGNRASGLTAGKPFTFLGSPANEVRPMFSPDGRWIAYSAGPFGAVEVFVRPFPGPGGQWRISRRGGFFPRWSLREPQLLFIEVASQRVMYVDYRGEGKSFSASEPAVWTPAAYMGRGDTSTYDPHPDGRRLVMRLDRKGRDTVVLFQNFFDYLKQILPENRGSQP